MRIIAKRQLMDMAAAHGDCVDQAAAWYAQTSAETWRSLADVRQTYSHADIVGDKTVFNIKGNSYRLITYINYKAGIVYIKFLLTHAEYTKGNWKS